ncbi:NADPH-dependent FMN reductase, partial [Lactococcus lactis subsp. lactis]|nr:NADPH-dependent FMN reductase [Lactococcus lactis subsp. lactis]MCT0068443.1 NADPH-dependent FMN reductase [Lactococcus lactis subsp. lactis]
AKEAFDNNGNLINSSTIEFLELCLDNFTKYVEVVSHLKKPKPLDPEDLTVGKPISTTIKGIDPDDPHWVEKASEQVGAVSGDTYVKLNHGLLTVDQINMFLDSMPFELT